MSPKPYQKASQVSGMITHVCSDDAHLPDKDQLICVHVQIKTN